MSHEVPVFRWRRYAKIGIDNRDRNLIDLGRIKLFDITKKLNVSTGNEVDCNTFTSETT
jgi:hypothetical protein